MPKLVTKLVVLSRPGTVAVLWGSLALLIVAATPARAQDLFGFFRVLFRPVAPVPAYQPFEYRAVPVPERPLVRPRPKAVRLEQPPIKMPTKPKAPGEVVNPLPELLADSTLRPGDLVMFPDGLRAFTG
ncbi:MAG TPA: hypothetical protein VHJ78_07160, partial [Actinomycetota bacterium]|nr:hypothetical protein [Actinomycetota bacterium]